MIDLNPKEKGAIVELKKIAKKWPKSLSLFSANGELCVMKTDKNGQTFKTPSGGVDQEFVITTIDIPNDGGDF